MAKKKTGKKASNETEELEKSYRELVPAKKETPKKKKRVQFVCLSCALILAIMTGLVYFIQQSTPILDGIYIAGVDVGGLTRKEAVKLLEASIGEDYGTNTMTVTVLDMSVEIPGTCITGFDIKAAVNSAHRFGRLALPQQRKNQQAMAKKGYILDLTPFLTVDKDAFDNALAPLDEKFNNIPKPSTYEVIGATPTPQDIAAGTNFQKLVVTLGIPEYSLDMDALGKQIMDAYSRHIFTVIGKCQIVDPDPVDLEEILQQHGVKEMDAYFDATNNRIVEYVPGYGFDRTSVAKQLEESSWGATIEVPFVQITPELTAAVLTKQMFPDTLATYTAYGSGTGGRSTNLDLSCKSVNGIILKSGDSFDYNQVLGERTAARGYKGAPAYMNGETIDSLGGGICQVSSSIYYCAMMADLEILDRTNHGYMVGYMPYGMDATVSWKAVEFRFRNNSNHPIQIVASASGGTTTVSIMGIDDKNYYVKMEYEIQKTYPSSTVYEVMTSDNPKGYKDGDVITTPYTGYDVKSYRCKYSKTTGELLSRTFETTSNYNKRDKVICKIEDIPPEDTTTTS